MKSHIFALITVLSLTACGGGGGDDNNKIGPGDPMEQAFGAYDIETTMAGNSILSFGILTPERMAVFSQYGEVAIYNYSLGGPIGTDISGTGKHYYQGSIYNGKIDSGTITSETIDATFSVTGIGEGTLHAEYVPLPDKDLADLAGTWVDAADGISSYVIDEDGEISGSDIYGCQVQGSVKQQVRYSIFYEGEITVFNCDEYSGERDVIMAWLDDIQAVAVFSFNDRVGMFHLLK
ncbi:hypothetical protein FCL40_17105 [Ferrimonas sediminicola]|uniref:Lipoprotein n=1 Tax=Ferrimonas sediminicola TaxID=2569538 RepID=A0A4U1B9S7_9GAMM|nr:hypothetical protein [Ferrimonas sediminicola]TKB46774.1 hypothetical protein FCL40_17105 [Ferrimonas sediminicola]